MTIRLFRLLYVSRSVETLRHSEVQAILNVSRRNNLQNGITGVLCVGGGQFMQVLEGPEKSVMTTYASILEDHRHTDCMILNAVPAGARVFKEWAMGCVQTGAEMPIFVKDALAFREASERQDQTVSMMRNLVAILQGRQHPGSGNARPTVVLDDPDGEN